MTQHGGYPGWGNEQQPADDLAGLASAASSARPAPPRAAANNSQQMVAFVAVTVLVLAALAGLAWIGTGPPSKPSGSAGPTSVTLGAGAAGILTSGSASREPVAIATTQADLDRLTKLSRARDGTGVAQMVMAGQVLLVDPGTGCKVIDPGLMVHEVRMTDGSYAGRSGFVPVEFVKPAK